jgi:hypothetical protein
VLARVGATSLELQPGRPFVIGRTQDCDLPIPSQRVSRRHAELFWREGRPWLKDLGSQNGTYVNGKRLVAEHELRDRDELAIGPWMCTFRCFEGGACETRAFTPADEEGSMTQPMLADAMAGSLAQLSLFELLQTLEFNHKTGTLDVFGPDGEGTLVIEGGAPVFCRCGPHAGNEALLTLLTFAAGQFSFQPHVHEGERNVRASMTSLLLEAGRRLDERAGEETGEQPDEEDGEEAGEELLGP